MIMARTKSREQVLAEIMGFGGGSDLVSEAVIQDRFHRSPYLPLRYIDCRLDDGTLVLSGRVPTFYLKQLAQTIASSLNGIRRVVNDLRVDFPRKRAS
jgi:osmotically-inducible protein OsmY